MLFHCDNRAVVEIWQKGSTRCKSLMVLVRVSFLLLPHLNSMLQYNTYRVLIIALLMLCLVFRSIDSGVWPPQLKLSHQLWSTHVLTPLSRPGPSTFSPICSSSVDQEDLPCGHTAIYPVLPFIWNQCSDPNIFCHSQALCSIPGWFCIL